MNAIEVDGLTRRYGDLVAVDEVSLTVSGGEILGLLGPNGAGKSTLVNTLCTLLRPSEGSARVAGYDVVADPDAVRSNIGVVFQEPALDEELTGVENLRFHARLYGVSGEHRRQRVRTVLGLVDLADDADKRVGEYSGDGSPTGTRPWTPPRTCRPLSGRTHGGPGRRHPKDRP
ncbi:ABC transporter ATP-binding protein [Haloarcula halophila]|uniref:ABC transporter ATP-binding protein n=1 Tax=Haloarcula halophila TaxID=3032584 RepID=UPI0023E39BAA|nr:ATP-binding cassette domain-containing protein [Halomicroarcula sp. DFY41]